MKYHTGLFPEEVKSSLTGGGASAFWHYRVINLKKLYPYISEKLNRILLHFTISTNRFYKLVNSGAGTIML